MVLQEINGTRYFRGDSKEAASLVRGAGPGVEMVLVFSGRRVPVSTDLTAPSITPSPLSPTTSSFRAAGVVHLSQRISVETDDADGVYDDVYFDVRVDVCPCIILSARFNSRMSTWNRAHCT